MKDLKHISNFFLIIFCTFVYLTLAGNPWKRVVLNRFGNCPNSENKSICLSNVHIKVEEPKLFITGNITVKADFPKELSVSVFFYYEINKI